MKILKALILIVVIPFLVSCSLEPNNKNKEEIAQTVKEELGFVDQGSETNGKRIDASINMDTIHKRQFILPEENEQQNGFLHKVLPGKKRVEYEFTLPKGFIDKDGNIHKNGTMGQCTPGEAAALLNDPRVQSNASYLNILLLSEAITSLGNVERINPSVIEGLFVSDFRYLNDFYNSIHGTGSPSIVSPEESETENGVESEGDPSIYPIEYEFSLPIGYIDQNGNIHKHGAMRLSTAADEILPLNDPRVQANTAYLNYIILSRVVTRLGDHHSINPSVIEAMHQSDISYLWNLYNSINYQGTLENDDQ